MRNASGHNYWNSSFIIDVAMGQIPRSTERISSVTNHFVALQKWILHVDPSEPLTRGNSECCPVLCRFKHILNHLVKYWNHLSTNRCQIMGMVTIDCDDVLL